MIWRNTLRDYRGISVNKAVSKADFGDLMKKSFDQLEPQTIINGFRASGLVPWNSNNIDYSKCLGTNVNFSNVSHESDFVCEENQVALPEAQLVADKATLYLQK